MTEKYDFFEICEKMRQRKRCFYCYPRNTMKNRQNAIYPEPLIVESRLTPHFTQKVHVSISVSYIMYLSDDRKCPKMPKMCQNRVKWPKWGSNPISREPGLLETWQTPHFNQKHVSMTVAYSSYTSQMTGTVQKCPNKVKRDQQASKGTNRRQKGPKYVKRGQEGSN